MGEEVWTASRRRRRRGAAHAVPKTWAEQSDEERTAHIKSLVANIDAKRAQLEHDGARARLDAVVAALRARKEPPECLLCLGIGKLDTTAAQFQLAMVLAFRARLEQHPPGLCTVTIYDPLFDAQDRALVARLDMALPKENQCGEYTLDRPTLVYMPKCPRALYEALLRANWDAVRLGGLVLCGNDLDAYVAQDTYPAMARAASVWHRYALPTCDEAPPGALDAVVHTFFDALDVAPELASGPRWARQPARRGRRRRGAARAPSPAREAALSEPSPDAPAFWMLPRGAPASDEVLATPIHPS